MGRLCNVVCVTGASSQLGVFLLPRLRDSGFRVLALGRQAPQKPLEVDERVTWMRTSFLADGERREQVVRHPPPDLLVSCGPLELALRLVLRYPGLQRIIAFSSSSVVSKSESADRAERRRMAAMVADEDALAAACAERGIPLLLLRPTMIYGCGMDRNVSLLAGLARRYGVIPLADLAIRALRARPPLGLASPVCGGTTLTYRDMAQRIAAALARRTRLLHLPEGLMVVLVRALSLLPGAPGINTEMVRRQNRDLVFDDSALRQALGWEPRPFEPTSADFAVPAEARTLQLPTALSHRPQERL